LAYGLLKLNLKEFYSLTVKEFEEMVMARQTYLDEQEKKEYIRDAWYTSMIINSILGLAGAKPIAAKEIMPDFVIPQEQKKISSKKELEKLIEEF